MSSESGSEDDWEDVEPLRADDGKSLGYRLHKNNGLPDLEAGRCLICGQKRHTVNSFNNDTFVPMFCRVF